MSETISIDRLKKDGANRNKHSGRGRRAVKDSFENFGAGRSILLDAKNNIICGNASYEAALESGIDDVIVVDTAGAQLVAVRRTDLDLTEKNGKARALSVSDNRSSELNLSWDLARLADDLREGLALPESILAAGEISAMLARQAEQARALAGEMERGETFGGGIPGEEGAGDAPSGLLEGIDADEIPEEVETRCKAGGLWACGEHKLLIGDCTDPANIARLFGNERLRLVWTDPPYGVSYADKNEFLNTLDRGNCIQTPIENDHMSPEATEALCRAALTLACERGEVGAACYVACPPGTSLPYFIRAFGASGFVFKHSLAWVKNQFVLGRCDYHYRHETILYGWKAGAHYFVDDHSQDSVFEVDRPRRSDVHPIMKPVGLVTRMVANSSRAGEIVYDPFTGSGTTLLACVDQGRTFRGCELSPAYGDVTLARWEAATGQEARRLA